MNWDEQGGSAFPIQHSNEPGTYEAECGMSLRDYFAGRALVAIIIATSAGHHDPSVKYGKGVEQSMAMDAYLLADAMLEARK